MFKIFKNNNWSDSPRRQRAIKAFLISYGVKKEDVCFIGRRVPVEGLKGMFFHDNTHEFIIKTKWLFFKTKTCKHCGYKK